MMQRTDYPPTYMVKHLTRLRGYGKGCKQCGKKFAIGDTIIIIEVRYSYMRGDDDYFDVCSEECRRVLYPNAKKVKRFV